MSDQIIKFQVSHISKTLIRKILNCVQTYNSAKVGRCKRGTFYIQRISWEKNTTGFEIEITRSLGLPGRYLRVVGHEKIMMYPMFDHRCLYKEIKKLKVKLLFDIHVDYDGVST